MKRPDKGMSPLIALASKAGSKGLLELVEWLNESSEVFTTLRRRPKATDGMTALIEQELQAKDAAVVMQGPPWVEDAFTFETLKLYRRRMPDNPIVYSTWNDTDEAVLGPIRDLGVEVVLSDKPDDPGLFNINMQIASARAGVLRAAEMGAKWVMKTRSDQRLLKEGFFSILIAMQKQFPVAGGTEQEGRVIGVGYGSLKYVPYHVTDQTVFGTTADMLRYWDIDNKTHELPPHFPKTISEVYGTLPIREQMNRTSPECLLASGFLERVGRPLEWTVVDHWKALRDHFCFVDYAMVDFFWVKTQLWTKGEHMNDPDSTYRATTNRKEVGFGEWLQLYTGTLPPEAGARYESTLDRKYQDQVPVPAKP